MFTRVKIRNIHTIKSLDIDFTMPLTIIIGPNGQGKTTFCEVLSSGLYGARHLRGTFPPKGEIFLEGTFPTKFVFHRKGKEVTWQGQKASIKEVEAYFEKYFVKHFIFNKFYRVFQGEISYLSSLTCSSLRNVLLEYFDLSILDSILIDLRKAIAVGGEPPNLDEIEKALLKATIHSKGLSYDEAYHVKDLQQQLAKAIEYDVNEVTNKLQQAEQEVTQLVTTTGRIVGRIDFIEKLLQLAPEDKCPVCGGIFNANKLRPHLEQELQSLKGTLNSNQDSVTKLKTLRSHWLNITNAPPKKVIEEALGEAKDINIVEVLEAVKMKDLLERRRNEIEEQVAIFSKLEKERRLTKLFSTFKDQYVAKLFERLESLCNFYLQQYTRFTSLKLSPDYYYLLDGRELQDYSGGEQALVNGILRFVLSQIHAETNFGTFPVMIYDSAFDMVDKDKVEGLFDLWRAGLCKQVIITTHDPSYEDIPDAQIINI